MYRSKGDRRVVFRWQREDDLVRLYVGGEYMLLTPKEFKHLSNKLIGLAGGFEV